MSLCLVLGRVELQVDPHAVVLPHANKGRTVLHSRHAIQRGSHDQPIFLLDRLLNTKSDHPCRASGPRGHSTRKLRSAANAGGAGGTGRGAPG